MKRIIATPETNPLVQQVVVGVMVQNLGHPMPLALLNEALPWLNVKVDAGVDVGMVTEGNVEAVCWVGDAEDGTRFLFALSQA